MKSVFEQTFTDYEYIIIDGGSTDGSKEYIEQHADKLTYWVSEKDGGVYEGMNKGIEKATGEYLMFLNSGDYLIQPKVLDEAVSLNLTEDIIYGNIVWEENGKQFDGVFPDKLTFSYFKNASLPHQGCFIRKKLFDQVGFYNTQYPIVADWKFFILAIFRYNVSYKQIPVLFSVCDRHGISCYPENWLKIVAAREKVVREYFGYFDEEITVLQNELKHLSGENLKIKESFGFRMQNKMTRFLKGIRR